MKKILFTYKRYFKENIILIANNHKDLEDYLTENYDWHKIVMRNIYVEIQELEGDTIELVSLKWVKHI